MIPTLSGVAFLLFLLMNREKLGLNRPLHMQLLVWLWNVARPDFDKSFYWAAGLLFLAAEYRWPARAINRRVHLHWDVASYVVGGIYIQLTALFFIALLPHHRPAILGGSHPIVRILVLLLVTDVIAYWSHRLRHTVPFWPIHRWHHAPEHLYWFSGNRTSAIDYLLLAGPSFLTFWFFSLSPREGMLVVLTYTFLNHWMHANVGWGTRWMEWLLVTPRYHHIHHSQVSEYFNTNFGIIFSFWDRIFCTFLDPDAIVAQYPLGLPCRTREKLRMMGGV